MQDFVARCLDEGLKTGLNTEQICIFMTTQLPFEMPQAAKLRNVLYRPRKIPRHGRKKSRKCAKIEYVGRLNQPGPVMWFLFAKRTGSYGLRSIIGNSMQ